MIKKYTFLLVILSALSYSSAIGDYETAIEDAKNAYPSEIRNLSPLTPKNKNTVWKDKKILMASLIPGWAAHQFYFPAFKQGGAFTTPTVPGVFMWVTAVPQLKNFIDRYKKTRNVRTTPNVLTRVQMLLGLPIKPNQTFYIAEFWVNPNDIFRPCPDAEIDDLTCEADGRIDNPAFNIFKSIQANEKHKAWFVNEKGNKYTPPYAFPWTRLGYTYDYYKMEKSNDPVGLSEYVLFPGKPITIKSITPFKEY